MCAGLGVAEGRGPLRHSQREVAEVAGQVVRRRGRDRGTGTVRSRTLTIWSAMVGRWSRAHGPSLPEPEAAPVVGPDVRHPVGGPPDVGRVLVVSRLPHGGALDHVGPAMRGAVPVRSDRPSRRRSFRPPRAARPYARSGTSQGDRVVGRSIEETVDYVAVVRLQRQYADIVDRRAWAELVDVFSPDVTIDLDLVTRPPLHLEGPDAYAAFVGPAIARFSFFEFVVLNTHVELWPGGGPECGHRPGLHVRAAPGRRSHRARRTPSGCTATATSWWTSSGGSPPVATGLWVASRPASRSRCPRTSTSDPRPRTAARTERSSTGHTVAARATSTQMVAPRWCGRRSRR